MQRDFEPKTPPRPVAMGCGLAVLFVILGVALIGGCIAFAESGVRGGRVTLRDEASYAPGTIEYSGEGNFFLVRLLDREFIALSDLDAANRANQARRCRAGQLSTADPALPRLLDTYRSRLSPEATGATVILQEGCLGAAYDLLGTRLDADGRNLDRFAVSVGKDGKVVVDTTKRTCSTREGRELRTAARCD